MKNLSFVLVVILISFSHQIYAQRAINPKIGFNYSRLADEPTVGKTKTKGGFNIGADFRFGDRFQFVPGIHYATHGLAFSGSQSPDIDNKISVHYLKVPIVGNFNIFNSDLFKLRVYGGFVTNFVLKVDASSFINKDNLSPINGGIRLGTGIDLGALTFDLNYEIGMLKYFDKGAVPALLYPNNTFNNVLTLSVGVRVNR